MNRIYNIPMLNFKVDHIGVMGTGPKKINDAAKALIENRVAERVKKHKSKKYSR